MSSRHRRNKIKSKYHREASFQFLCMDNIFHEPVTNRFRVHKLIKIYDHSDKSRIKLQLTLTCISQVVLDWFIYFYCFAQT